MADRNASFLTYLILSTQRLRRLYCFDFPHVSTLDRFLMAYSIQNNNFYSENSYMEGSVPWFLRLMSTAEDASGQNVHTWANHYQGMQGPQGPMYGSSVIYSSTANQGEY